MLIPERLINHVKSHEGVRFTTMSQVAAEFRETRTVADETEKETALPTSHLWLSR